MRKRPHSKRPKRSGQHHDRQERQKLSKEIRGLYRSPSTEEDPETEWHDDLEAQLEPTPRGRRPPPAGLSAREAAKKTASHRPETAQGPERAGTVIEIFSGACQVDDGERTVDCILPSELARDQRAAIAVGDQVAFARHGDHDHRLLNVAPRRTVLSRPDPQNPRRERVIAANIDVAVHIASVVRPPLRPALIDRYLIAIERGGARAVVCVNKIDLLTDPLARREEMAALEPYRTLGLEILACSAKTGEGLNELRTLLRGRTAVLVGHSGVGKSSLLNALSPDLAVETGRVNAHLGTGRHTTTRSSLYRLTDEIRIIDTPGIRELGLWQLTPVEARAYFPEFEEHAGGCRFADCSHRHEPDCAVMAAVETGEIADARYATYARIVDSLEASDRD